MDLCANKPGVLLGAPPYLFLNTDIHGQIAIHGHQKKMTIYEDFGHV